MLFKVSPGMKVDVFERDFEYCVKNFIRLKGVQLILLFENKFSNGWFIICWILNLDYIGNLKLKFNVSALSRPAYYMNAFFTFAYSWTLL